MARVFSEDLEPDGLAGWNIVGIFFTRVDIPPNQLTTHMDPVVVYSVLMIKIV